MAEILPKIGYFNCSGHTHLVAVQEFSHLFVIQGIMTISVIGYQSAYYTMKLH